MGISSEENVSFWSKLPLKNINIFYKGSKVERDRFTQTNLTLLFPNLLPEQKPYKFSSYEILSSLSKQKGRSGLEVEIIHNRTLLL